MRSRALVSPSALAIAAPDREPLTYRALLEQALRVGSVLEAAGIGRNDRVAAVLENGPELGVTFLGVAAHATFAPLNPAYGEEAFDFYLSDLGAVALIVEAGVESVARNVARERGIPLIELHADRTAPAGAFDLRGPGAGATRPAGFAEPDDPALVLHTSGTTARPKIVPLSGRNLCTSGRNVRTSLALTDRDRCLNVMPLFHIHGLVAAVLASLDAGASVVCTPGFFATDVPDWLERCGATWYTAVPTMHQSILAPFAARGTPPAGLSLRFIRSSSAALPVPVIAELERVFGVPVIEAYGMTEAAHQMACNPLPPRVRKPGSVGPAAGPDVAVMNERGELLAPGAKGEVVIRGPNVMAGYENNPTANAAAFANGWFRTGDEGYLDRDGYLFLTGRLKEIINRGGEKIAPREVDDVLLEHADVAQAVAFAMPHPTLGEEVAAAVVRREGGTVTAPELREFAAARLVHFKVPRRIVFVSEIPKGATGKVQRIGLAERIRESGAEVEAVAGEGAGAGIGYVGPRTELERVLAEIWAEVLQRERVGVEDSWFDLGGDSMLATRVAARVEDRLGLELTLPVFFEHPTIAGVAAVLEAARPDGGSGHDAAAHG
ncbi:MAG: AMP-binding protein [Gemmatimonadota bacterium]